MVLSLMTYLRRIRLFCILALCAITVFINLKSFWDSKIIFEETLRSIESKNNLLKLLLERSKQTKAPTTPKQTRAPTITTKQTRAPTTAKVSMKHSIYPLKLSRSLVDGFKRRVLLISAFYDDRAGLGKQACVRIIIIRDVKITPVDCILLSDDLRPFFAKKAWLQRIGVGMKYESYYFREEVVSCCVTRSMRPVFVRLTYFDDFEDNSNKDEVLRVQYPPKPKTPPRTIINCVSGTYGDPDPKRIVEWLELQRLLGMDKVEIHDINMSRRARRVFDAYSKETSDGLVEVLDFITLLSPGYYNLLFMSPAITECVYRNMYLYKAVAVFDLDEVIYPQMHGTYEKLLNHLRNLSISKSRKYPYFSFYNVYYYTNVNISRPKAWTSTFTRYIHHIKPSPFGKSVKSIIDPAGCYAAHNHFCLGDIRDRMEENSGEKWPHTEIPGIEVAANKHYKFCDECKENLPEIFEDRSMLMLQNRLDPVILKKLRALGLAG